MKKIILNEKNEETIRLEDIDHKNTPIFAKRYGKIIGMVVKEDGKWILKTGGGNGATGHHITLLDCIKSCLPHDFTFFVN